MANPPIIVFLNGEFVDQQAAMVSVLDRGFLLGDGVYEVIPVFGSRPFRLKQHIDRLNNSLEQTRIPNPLSTQQWQQMLHTLIEKNGSGDQSLYVQITRGAVSKRDHAFPEKPQPTVFAMANPTKEIAQSELEKGFSAITLDDIRWQRCDIKSISLLANVLLRQQALDNHSQEAILIRNGFALEGAASNVFMVASDQVITPPKDRQILPGITRDLIVELALNNNITLVERPISESELRKADEIWLSSSVREIVPVTELDQTRVGTGKPGPLWHRIIDLYRNYKRGFGD